MSAALTATAILDQTRTGEEWKYTSLKDVLEGVQPASPTPTTVPVTRAEIEALAGQHRGDQIVIVDGRYNSDLSDTGSTVLAITTNRGDNEALVSKRDDVMERLNRAETPGATFIDVPADAPPDTSLHVVYISTTSDDQVRLITQPRTEITIGQGAHLDLAETYVGLPGANPTNTVTVLRLSGGASVNHTRIQNEPEQSHHVGLLVVEQERASELRSTSILAGARISRFAADVTVVGDDAVTDLAGLAIAHDHQQQDHTVTIDHASHNAHSIQTYRAVVDDRAKAAFTGHVIVRPDCAGTDAQQNTRSLVMSDHAESNSRPWLEIHTDDVRCTHGATVGRLDDEQLFYLRSRGIPLDQATAILTSAFAAEIISRINPDMAQHTLSQLDNIEDLDGRW